MPVNKDKFAELLGAALGVAGDYYSVKGGGTNAFTQNLLAQQNLSKQRESDVQKEKDLLDIFRQKERIKKEESETVAALDRASFLLDKYNKIADRQKVLGNIGIQNQQQSDKKEYNDLLGAANNAAVKRGIIKKATGADLPQSDEEFLLDTKRKAMQESAVLEEKKKTELKVKMDDFKSEYDSFRQINNVLQPFRSTGGISNRLATGAKLFWEGKKANTPLGNAISTYDASVKKLRVTIARLKDVGNLSAVEQMAAQAIIPGKWDTQETAALKDAYLQEIANGIDKKDYSAVRSTIERWMKSPEWKNQIVELWDDMSDKEKNKRTFNNEEDADNANLPSGTLVKISGKIYIKD